MSSAWRPSNGTEGEVFAANRCERCVNDRWDHTTATGQSCPIWMNALAGVDDVHLYWDADAGHGECDMFYPKSEARAAGLDAAREAVEAIRDALQRHYRIDCEPAGKVDWSQHRRCDPVDDILAAIDALKETNVNA